MPDPIERLRALLEAASPGRWFVYLGNDEYGQLYESPTVKSPIGGVLEVNDDGLGNCEGAADWDDAQLIATLRNLAPHFLALWEAMRVHIYEIDDMRDVAARKTYAEIGHYVATVLPGLAGVLHDLDEAARKEVRDA